MKKYELTTNTKTFLGRTLYQIKALVDFGDVKAGDLGGYIEKEGNLSQEGNAWVYGDARVYGNARVFGDARVTDNAWVSGDARVTDNAWVYGDARVYGNALVYGDARVFDNAWVYGNALVSGDAWVYGNARVSGNALVFEEKHILTIGPIGSRNDTTTFYCTEEKDINVNCGCFNGSVDDFIKQVSQTHGDNKHAKAYKMAVELAKLQIDLSEGE
ncbi:MAG: hypothetical protein J1F17_05960 [Oscillospiraceae bacterium]|nr:hypothetical protein [Oscillospiraceae bacterium]